MVLFVLWTPYNHILDDVYHPGERGWDAESYSICYYLKGALHGNRNISGSHILYEQYHPEMTFYTIQLKEKNQLVLFKTRKEVSIGDIIITHESSMKEFIETNFEFQKLEEWKNVSRYKIVAKK